MSDPLLAMNEAQHWLMCLSRTTQAHLTNSYVGPVFHLCHVESRDMDNL